MVDPVKVGEATVFALLMMPSIVFSVLPPRLLRWCWVFIAATALLLGAVSPQVLTKPGGGEAVVLAWIALAGWAAPLVLRAVLRREMCAAVMVLLIAVLWFVLNLDPLARAVGTMIGVGMLAGAFTGLLTALTWLIKRGSESGSVDTVDSPPTST
jgi:hypothetical protein